MRLTRSENGMYERKAQQVAFFEDATLLGGIRLNPENRWICTADLLSIELDIVKILLRNKNPCSELMQESLALGGAFVMALA